MVEAFFAAWLGILVAQLAPGPNLLAVASAALGQGRRAALFVALGVAVGSAVWIVATTLGLVAVLLAVPASIIAMKILGGGYQLVLSVRALLAAMRGSQFRVAPGRAAAGDASSFLRGLLVVLTNPKSVLAWAAMVAFLFGHGIGAGQAVWFTPVGAVSALVVYSAYAVLFSTSAATRVYARAARWFEAAFGAVFGILGGALLADGIRSLRS